MAKGKGGPVEFGDVPAVLTSRLNDHVGCAEDVTNASNAAYFERSVLVFHWPIRTAPLLRVAARLPVLDRLLKGVSM